MGNKPSLVDAVAVAEEFWNGYGLDDDERDRDFTQEPDDKPLTMRDDDEAKRETKPAAEWAASEGRGFLGSTEW